MSSKTVIENSTKLTVESWFVPFDILMITCNALSIILATLLLGIIIFDKTCRTVPLLLIANSCLSSLVFASFEMSMNSFTFYKDLNQLEYQDPWCALVGYLCDSSASVQNYSFLLQGIYRYLLIVYPKRLFWQSARIQLVFIGISWIIAFVYPLQFLLTGQVVYDIENQVCQLYFRSSFSIIYFTFCSYIIPISALMFIYLILVRYVKKMSTHVTPANTLIRAQRDLKMIRRTVILVIIALMVCFPYEIFLIMSFFNHAPKYHLRIAYISADVSMICVLITLFLFNDPLKKSARKIMIKANNAITPIVT